MVCDTCAGPVRYLYCWLSETNRVVHCIPELLRRVDYRVLVGQGRVQRWHLGASEERSVV